MKIFLMRSFLQTFTFLISINVMGQIDGMVLDSNTKQPVQFASIWVSGKNIGVSTDINGHFQFIQNLLFEELVISSIGYEQIRFRIDKSIVTILLNPKVYNIHEVIIRPIKTEEITISKYKRSQVYEYISSSAPVIYAAYLPCPLGVESPLFLKSLKIETYSKIDATFNLRLFFLTEDGKPGDDMISNTLNYKVKKGRRSLVIDDLEHFKIGIPKNGLFIGLEFLVLKENIDVLRSKNIATKKIEKVVAYMPLFGTIVKKNTTPIWIFVEGNWECNNGRSIIGTSLHKANQNLAMEVILTN